jgi:hypothetical protein
MNPDITSTLVAVAPLASVVSVTVAMVQLFKNIDEEGTYRRYYPVLSFVIGMALSIYIFGLDISVALVTALSASGSYDFAKQSILGIEPTGSVKAEDQTPEDPELPSPPTMGDVADFVHPEE